ncbi:MAG: LiaF transmembrane domain-containing protein, partial [Candidatus Limnocylindria bacterium]
MFWPLVLIGVGLVALLGNYGLIQSVSVASILALWPALLILLGIDIAFSRRWPAPTLAAEVAIIGAALLLAATQPATLSFAAFTFGGANACPRPTASSSVARGSLRSLTLRIDGGAARYRLVGGAGDAVEVTSDRREICLRDRSSGSRGDVRISQAGVRFGSGSDVVVTVANDLPVSLEVNAGAGEFVMDLRDVRTTDAHLSVGASSTTVILPRPTGDVPIELDGGASSVSIVIPSDVEARISVSGGLISTTSTNPRATKTGNVVETPGYRAAT